MANNSPAFAAAQNELDAAVAETSRKIEELGEVAGKLCARLQTLQNEFRITYSQMEGFPQREALKYREIVAAGANWKRETDQILQKSDLAISKSATTGIVGVGVGVAAAALGPTAAMGIATTVGVASTGTAISALSGAAATNAALAWLGGGVLAAGGGGTAAGSAMLALFGPVGWTIAGVALLGSAFGVMKSRLDRERLENIFVRINEREKLKFEEAGAEIDERIRKMGQEDRALAAEIRELHKLGESEEGPTDTSALDACLEQMQKATALLTTPIQALQPKYTKNEWDAYRAAQSSVRGLLRRERAFLWAANTLDCVYLDDKDRDVFQKFLSQNKEFLTTYGLERSDVDNKQKDFLRIASDFAEFTVSNISLGAAHSDPMLPAEPFPGLPCEGTVPDEMPDEGEKTAPGKKTSLHPYDPIAPAQVGSFHLKSGKAASFNGKNKTYRTIRNELVRSKSEMTIANILYFNDVPYEYEPVLEYHGNIKRPDFAVRGINGRIWIWEHCGVMAKPEYKKRWIEKRDLYRNGGIEEGKNLIVTEEDEGKNLDSAAINGLVLDLLKS